MNDLYIMDACPLIASIAGEVGAEKVHEILNRALDGEVTIEMNKINLLEVYYDVYKTYGQNEARKFLEDIKNIPIKINPEITDEVLEEAGRFKVMYKIFLADSIVLAETKINNSSIITADHHEFDIIEKTENMIFFWIR